MKPKNIETSYGKFPSMIHYEKYWERKVQEAREKGFNSALEILERDIKSHRKLFKKMCKKVRKMKEVRP